MWSPAGPHRQAATTVGSEGGAAGPEVGGDDGGDVDGEDLGAVLVEVEAVVGANVLADAVAGVDDVLRPAAVAAGEALPRVDELHVGAGVEGGAHGAVLHGQARGHLRAVVVRDADPHDGPATGGEQVHHLAGAPRVLGQPHVLGPDGIVPLRRVRAVG